MTIAYLANEFPVAVEPYVGDEIAELEKRGAQVIAASVRKSSCAASSGIRAADVVLLPLSIFTVLRAARLCVRACARLIPVLNRVIFCGREGPLQRCKALAHTFLGACLAVRLKVRGVEHIHVHHGYFGSWVGMIAARLLGAGFSFTLHGSDLLLHGTYLDAKLAACTFCITVSEYNRRFILARYPSVKGKVFVSRMGVDSSATTGPLPKQVREECLKILAVGRLHPVKDHAFLLRGCARLVKVGIAFECSIAGEGSERGALESLIRELDLTQCVRLLGHVPREDVGLLYEQADLVVLTSKSEGIPLVLMEAMARGRIVLAPRMTGIPELVAHGKSGFLYKAGDMDSFIEQVLLIRSLLIDEAEPITRIAVPHAHSLRVIRQAAHLQVVENFNRSKNLQYFADLFLGSIARRNENAPDENLVLQQI